MCMVIQNDAAKAVGKILQEARNKKKITQYQLAKKIKVAVGTICNIEEGTTKNSGFFTVCAMADTLDVPIEQLLSVLVKE